MPWVNFPSCDYCVTVSRRGDRPRVGFWPFRVRDPMPVIPIPLRPGEPEPRLDRQSPHPLAYAHDVVTVIRARTGRPNEIIHLIGGLASGAPPAAFAAFDQAASDCGVDGLSFYEFPLTTASEWSLLSETPLGQTVQPSCAG